MDTVEVLIPLKGGNYRKTTLKAMMEGENLNKMPPTLIDENGTKVWKNERGQIHRGGDLPAKIYKDGKKEWWHNGMRNRWHGAPAVEYPNGSKEYWLYGKFTKKTDGSKN